MVVFPRRLHSTCRPSAPAAKKHDPWQCVRTHLSQHLLLSGTIGVYLMSISVGADTTAKPYVMPGRWTSTFAVSLFLTLANPMHVPGQQGLDNACEAYACDGANILRPASVLHVCHNAAADGAVLSDSRSVRRSDTCNFEACCSAPTPRLKTRTVVHQQAASDPGSLLLHPQQRPLRTGKLLVQQYLGPAQRCLSCCVYLQVALCPPS